MGQSSKTKTVTRHKNLNCDKTQKLKLLQDKKKLGQLKHDKLNNLKYDQTQKIIMWHNSYCKRKNKKKKLKIC